MRQADARLAGRPVQISDAGQCEHGRGKTLSVKAAGQFQGLALGSAKAKIFHQKENIQGSGHVAPVKARTAADFAVALTNIVGIPCTFASPARHCLAGRLGIVCSDEH